MTTCIESVGTSKTYKKETPCLNLYISIIYKNDDPDRIDYVKIHGTSRGDDCGCSYHEALADLLTFSIRRIRNHHEAISIVKNLRDHKCHKMRPNKEKITSCADAIGRAVQDALKVTENELRGRA